MMIVYDRFYSSPVWKAARSRAVRLSGFRCSSCDASVAGRGAARVDHIQTVRSRPDLALVESNLRVLCVPCDAARHAEKGRGGQVRPTIGPDGFAEGSPWST